MNPFNVKLFNYYKNKDFITMISFINSSEDYGDSLIKDAVKVLKEINKTYDEIIDSILNKNESPLYLFNGIKLNSIDNFKIPITLSLAEEAWLYYILNHKFAKLFFENEDDIKELQKSFVDYHLYPIRDEYIEYRSIVNDSLISSNIFQDIFTAVIEHKYIDVVNHAFNGKIYHNQKLYPYKIEFNPVYNNFSLSTYSTEHKRPIKINLSTIKKVHIHHDIDTEDIQDNLSKVLSESIKAKKTINLKLKIDNYNNGYERALYILSGYDYYTLNKSDYSVELMLNCYDFEKNQLFNDLLFLGSCITILSPSSLMEEFKEIIKLALNNYD